jgi:hypothetical protein
MIMGSAPQNTSSGVTAPDPSASRRNLIIFTEQDKDADAL